MGVVEHSLGSLLILLTGGTGYVGGRLLKGLEASGSRTRSFAQTCWSDALSSAGPQRSWGGVPFGTRLVDSHRCPSIDPLQRGLYARSIH